MHRTACLYASIRRRVWSRGAGLSVMAGNRASRDGLRRPLDRSQAGSAASHRCMHASHGILSCLQSSHRSIPRNGVLRPALTSSL